MKQQPKILFIDSVHPILQKELENMDYQCNIYTDLTSVQILDIIHKYIGIVIRSKIKLDKPILEKAVNLKFIARAGAGMENIDVNYAESKGIKCINAPEGNRDAVGEHALGMLLLLFNKLSKANQEVKKGIWEREENRGMELMDKTVGIIGYGNTASAFAKRLKGFETNVIAYDKYKTGFTNEFVKEVNLEEIFVNTDILSLHIPLTEETHYMVNGLFINKFLKNIYLINTSRGQVVKTDDLVKKMKAGKILGACLDVLEYESSSFEHLYHNKLPSAFQYLIKSNDVILSPHIAGWTYQSHKKISEVLAEKIKALFL